MNRMYRMHILAGLLFLIAFPARAQYVHLKVPITLSDNQHRKTTVYFGVDPYATRCIDANMGEFELPADQCGAVSLCAYFADPPSDGLTCFGNGLLLDMREYTSRYQFDGYNITFTSTDYPITFHWPKNLALYYDSINIHDAITGTLFSTSMVSAESLVVSNTSIQTVLIDTYGPQGVLDVVKEKTSVPSRTTLCQNYPNPFNPSTNIHYALSQPSDVVLRIYSVTGSVIATLVHERQSAGEHDVSWNADRVPSGIYFYRLITPAGIQSKSMLVLK